MGNIAGRSKGCSTCRGRRIKCDEQQPICNRCQRCGLECTGVRGITFIEQGMNLRPGERRRSISSGRDSNNGRNWTSAKIRVPTSLSTNGSMIQASVIYTKTHLLRGGGPVDLALRDLQMNDILSAAETPRDPRLFHLSILSLATIFFGSKERNPIMRERGYVLYGTTLKQLNHALSEPNCYMRDDVLLSVITLTLLECFAPTGRNHYTKHMLGLERLMELRGPTVHDSSKPLVMKSFQFFQGIRHLMLFTALRERKPSILARQEWKKIRWIGEQDETEGQVLFNILADCTVVVAECDKVADNCELDIWGNPLEGDKVAQKALNVLAQLHLWKSQWDNKHRFETISMSSGGLHLVHGTGENNISSIPTPLNFTNDNAAQMLMLYNTILIYVFRVLLSLSSQNLESLSSFQSNSHHNYASLETSAALEICSCLPYVLSRKAHMSPGSLTAVHLTIRTAWTTLGRNNTAEGKWITDSIKGKDSQVFAIGLWGD